MIPLPVRQLFPFLLLPTNALEDTSPTCPAPGCADPGHPPAFARPVSCRRAPGPVAMSAPAACGTRGTSTRLHRGILEARLPCSGRCGVSRTRICTAGCVAGLLWRSPVGCRWVPRASRACPVPREPRKRGRAAGAPVGEALLIVAVQTAIRRRLMGARDLIIDSAPILAWWRRDPDARIGHAPAHHPRPLLRGYRVHTRCSAEVRACHCSFCSRPPMSMTPLLLGLSSPGPWPSIRSARASSGSMRAIGDCVCLLGSIQRWARWPSCPGTPSDNATAPACRPPGPLTELGKRTAIERFFGRVFLFFRLQRPPL